MTSSLLKQEKVQFEDYWPNMRPVILRLLKQESINNSEWQDLFWNIYIICMWDEKGPANLYAALKDDILDFIHQAQIELLANQEDQALLKAYITAWTKFFNQCYYLPKPFAQVEQALNSKAGPKKNGNEQGMLTKLMHESWNSNIFSNINYRLQNSAMKLVLAERNGEAFDSQLVIGVRESYVNLCSTNNDKQIYRENFEKAYLEATEAFYSSKGREFLAANGVHPYMVWAHAKLNEEEQRAAKYLESSSFDALCECCVNILVTSIKDTLLAECATMIKNNETAKLELMFRLIDRVPNGITPMLTDLENFIINRGLADMMACVEIITQDSEKYVELLLGLFRRFSQLVKEAFNDDPRFLTSRDKAFRQIVNDTSVFRLELSARSRWTGQVASTSGAVTTTTTTTSATTNKIQPESRCPELLANYCDMLLRKTPLSRKLTSDEIEAKLKEVLLVLKYVKNKDVFMRYHKAHLTRRLILDTSADNEKEENMVEWLRELGMPADYVNKLSRMFQDIKVSEDLNNQFKKTKAQHMMVDGGGGGGGVNGNDGDDLTCHNMEGDCSSSTSSNTFPSLPESINIKILNAGAWARGAERVQVSLPLDLEDIIPEIEDFYRKKHSGRKLQWYHHMSNGTISFTNRVGTYDLDVTTFQMAVLFTWNERPQDKISFENLRLATELPDIELRRTLWSLVAFPKLKRQILLSDCDAKSPKDFTDSTLFWANQEFTIIKNSKPQRRGRVNLIGRLQLSTEKCKEEDNESIIQLRILRTQEAIVKIMKMRRKMNNSQLQTELVEMLKNFFLPSKKMIKEQIEWLIEHKYIKRDEDNIGLFCYIA